MMHLRDDLAEKVQELDEELTMALSELKRLKMANKKHITEVCPSRSMRLCTPLCVVVHVHWLSVICTPVV